MSLVPVFTTPSADVFRALVVGWTLCPTRRTVTGLIPFADPDPFRAHDAFHRFFRAGACRAHASVSRMRCDASLYALPEPRRPGQRRRPRKKGWRLPHPTPQASCGP